MQYPPFLLKCSFQSLVKELHQWAPNSLWTDIHCGFMLVRPAIIRGYILVANQTAELFKRLSQIFLCNSDRSRASFPSFYPSLVFLFRCCCLHLCFILCSFHRQLSYVWLICLSSFFQMVPLSLTDNFHLSQCVFKINLHHALKACSLFSWTSLFSADLSALQLFNFQSFDIYMYIYTYIMTYSHV